MKKLVAFAIAGGLLAAPISALVPFGKAGQQDAELTGKKKRRSVPVAKPSPTPTASPAPSKIPIPPPPAAIDPQSFEGRILGAHNAERRRLGIAPLVWSPKLTFDASGWAQSLAAKGQFAHSQNRGNVGENLWMGTAGYYTPEAMIGAFIGEKQYFRAGKFPEVSTTGKWSDVGHYTQLIWPGTREVGCAIARGNGRDLLVCRYAPAGNVIGQQVP